MNKSTLDNSVAKAASKRSAVLRSYAAPIALLCGLMASAGAACAEDAAPTNGPAPEAKVDEVTVTGSRILRNGNNAPTPVTVVTEDSLNAITPSNIFNQLNVIPAFVPTYGAQTPSGLSTMNNTGVSALNLRGLGAQRALVLFDGQRLPPSTPDGLVNVNLLPQMLIQRVDVVTGGASAVYGSDAVSGVINFILDRKFNGLKLDAQGGDSSRNDDKTYQLGIAGGLDLFGGRGHFEASWERSHDDGLSYASQTRPNIFNWTVQGSGTTADPLHLVQGVTDPVYSDGGLIRKGPLKNYNFSSNGVLTPFNAATDGWQNNSDSLLAASTIDQGFARLDYDFTDHLHGYANLVYARDYETGAFSPGVDGRVAFGACNAFLQPAYQAQMGCTNAAVQQSDPNQYVFTLNKVPNPLINLLKTTLGYSTTTNINVIAGLEGDFGKAYHWETSFTYGQTAQKVEQAGTDEDPHWYAALDAVVNPANGQIVCNVTLTNPGLYPGCVPINMFGPSSESQAALNYSFGTVGRTAINKTIGWEGALRGEPFSLWAGPVGMAISGDFRRQSLGVTSTSLPDNPTMDCLGLRFGNCDPTSPQDTHTWGNFVIPLPTVNQNIYEAALEVDVPLVKDLPFVKSLSTNDAVRYALYQNSGGSLDLNGNPTTVNTNFNATNWKLGLVWTVNDQLTIRATRSRDMRAPNLYDLFNPQRYNPNTIGASDYLCPPGVSAGQAGCPIDVAGGTGGPSFTGGNPSLKPEIGDTVSAGFVFRPMRSLSLAVDYYDIKITDAITVLNGSDPTIQQDCYASGGKSPLCALQLRSAGNYTYSPTNTVLAWYSRGVNLGQLATSGIDMELNYRTAIADHTLSVRALATYMEHRTITEFGSVTEYAGTNGDSTIGQSPKWRVNVQLNYNVLPGLDFSAAERWRSAMRFQTDPTLVESGDVAAVAYTDMNLSYALPYRRGLTVFLNVRNLLDQAPPHAGRVLSDQPGGTGDGYSIGDDPIGRYFTLGIRGRF
ncbi:MAG TPA: TonB-dependent receptor [Caulobacteraceae bacterium]|nr:TonB-dependent receptor [Caulobacteraceae bacterium]